MARAKTIRRDAEELVNSITHGVGLVLSIAGFVVLLTLAVMHGSALRIVSCAIYGSTLICVYAASTLYHGIAAPRCKRALKIFDHCAIYLLIAGTYTPFLLVNLGGGWGWSLLGVIWGLAMAGILLKFWFGDHCGEAAAAARLGAGNRVAACGRVDVHDRSGIFRRATPALWPRDLACVRDGRKHLSLHCGAVGGGAGG